MAVWTWYQTDGTNEETVLRDIVPNSIPALQTTVDAPLVLVQARMGSTRLPGKVLQDIAGQPLLGHLLDRLLLAVSPDKIMITTGDDPANDAIAEFCSARNIAVSRGPEHDVSSRMIRAIEETGASAFVRLCADSPVLAPDLIAFMIAAWNDRPANCQFISNVQQRSFPKGQSLEIADSRFYMENLPADDAESQEHVTSFLYRPGVLQPGEGLFLKRTPAIGDLRHCIDIQEDKDRIINLLHHATVKTDTGLEALVAFEKQENL